MKKNFTKQAYSPFTIMAKEALRLAGNQRHIFIVLIVSVNCVATSGVICMTSLHDFLAVRLTMCAVLIVDTLFLILMNALTNHKPLHFSSPSDFQSTKNEKNGDVQKFMHLVTPNKKENDVERKSQDCFEELPLGLWGQHFNEIKPGDFNYLVCGLIRPQKPPFRSKQCLIINDEVSLSENSDGFGFMFNHDLWAVTLLN